jgi:hypothetical protein
MSQTVINQWSALCIEENIMVDIWSPDTPSICPNPTAHTSRALDTNRIIFVKEIKASDVKLIDETPGYYQNITKTLDVPANDPDSVSSHDLVWDNNIKIWTTEFFPQVEHIGDSITVIMDPERLVGVIVEDTVVGSNKIYVSPTVFSYPDISCGIEVVLKSATGAEQNLGPIVSLDYTNYTMDFATTINSVFPANTTAILFNIIAFKNKKITRSGYPYIFGTKGFNTKTLPANVIMRFLYTNHSGDAKKVHIDFEYNIY